MTKTDINNIIKMLEERLEYYERMALSYDDRANNMLLDDAQRHNLENAREYVRGKSKATAEALHLIYERR